MADIPESTKSEHVAWTVDATSYLRNLDSEDLHAETIAVHHQSAPEETETGTRISLRFPTLIVSGYCSEPREVADRVARILNAHWDEPAAPPAMDREAVEKDVAFLREAARYFANRPTDGEDRAHWSNVANSESCERIANHLSTLSADAIRQGEGDMERAAKIAESYEPMGYMSEREREYCREHGQEIADRIRIAATPASHASDGGKA